VPLRILQYVCILLDIMAESAAAASAIPVVSDIASVDHLYVMLLLLLLLIWWELVTVDCFAPVRATVTTVVHTLAPAANNLAPVCLLQRWIVSIY
jgi:hypothetical protein